MVGGLLTVQAAANVQLSTAMRSPMGAATLQLAVAAVLLVLASVLTGAAGAFGLVSGVVPWHLLGGLGSAVYITAGILLFPRLGALVTVGLFITGQMLASLLLDSLGLLGVPQEPLRVAALIGAAAVLTGAALIVRSQASSPNARAPGVVSLAGAEPVTSAGAVAA